LDTPEAEMIAPSRSLSSSEPRAEASRDPSGSNELSDQGSDSAQVSPVAAMPVGISQFKKLTDEQKNQYLRWFDEWLQTPPEERFKFLISATSGKDAPIARISRKKTR
jgi:hypothetical protein